MSHICFGVKTAFSIFKVLGWKSKFMQIWEKHNILANVVKDQKLNGVFKLSKENQRKYKRLQELEREFSE